MSRDRDERPQEASAAASDGSRVRLPIHLIGNVNLDIVMGPVEPWPQPGTERIVERQEVRVGGAAGVAAMALQALQAPFRLHARIGDDAFGDIVRREMGPAGEQLEVVHTSAAYSVGVTHPDGERTFFTHLGHLAELGVEAIAEELEGSEPGLVLVCGYFLMPGLRFGRAQQLMRRARGAGHRVLFDSGWPSDGFTGEVRAELIALLPFVDILLPNEVEAMGWAGAGSVEQALYGLEGPDRRVIVKRGPNGASWLDHGEPRTVLPPAVAVQDSVGAGDCFNAALVSRLRDGRPAEQAVVAAVRYGSAVAGTAPRRYPGWIEAGG